MASPLAAYVPGASVPFAGTLVVVLSLVLLGLVLWGLWTLFERSLDKELAQWKEEQDLLWEKWWAAEKARSAAFWAEEERKSREWMESLKR